MLVDFVSQEHGRELAGSPLGHHILIVDIVRGVPLEA